VAVYLVTYDLKQGSGTHDYQDLYDALDAYENHKVLYSVRLVSTSIGYKALFDDLLQHMDPKDRLWVTELRKSQFTYRAMAGTNDWLKRHPPRP
jgi:hypothetical protein